MLHRIFLLLGRHIKFIMHQARSQRGKNENIHLLVEQFARVPDVHGSLNLVAREDPYFNSSLPYVKDGLINLLLQFVLDRRRSDQLKVDL